MNHEHIDIKFPDRKGLKSIAAYHKAGNDLTEGLDLLLERNYRTELIPAKLIAFSINEIPNDISGMGKYMDAKTSALVEYDNKREQWPFTMIYVKP